MAPNEIVELVGWKQICSHLGVSEPTARKWRRELGLPVYELGGRVRAEVRQLDRWMAEIREGQEEPGRNRAPWRRWIFASLCVGLLLLGVRLALRPGEISEVQYDGDQVTALDSRGRVVFSRPVPGLDSEALAGNKFDLHAIADVDSDEKNEVLLNYWPLLQRSTPGKLLLIDDSGDIVWEHLYGRELSVAGRRFEPIYNAAFIRWLDMERGRAILAVGRHSTWFPAPITLLDPLNGDILDEYWHPGYANKVEILDWDGDSRKDLLLAGVNNPGPGIGHPVLAILPLPFDQTRSQGGNYFGDWNNKEIDYYVFGRPAALEAQSVGAAIKEVNIYESGTVMVAVGFPPDEYIYYYFDENRQIVDFRPSDGYVTLHRRLVNEGILSANVPIVGERAAVLRLPTAPDGNDPGLPDLIRRASASGSDSVGR